MLSIQLRRNCNYRTSPCQFLQKRKAHRSPDFKFLQESKNAKYDNNLYHNHYCYGEPIVQSACEVMSLFPKLMENAIKTSAAMAAQDYVPFFHGEPPGFNAIRIFMNTLIQSKHEKNSYKYFRFPSPKDNIERSELLQRIDQYIAENGSYKTSCENTSPTPLDINSKLRPHLLSLSYAMTSNLSEFESAYWFTFHPRTYIDKINDVFAKAAANSMRLRGYSSETTLSITQEMGSIFNEYAELKVGTLAVIGVPKDKLSIYVYDSKSMGHPTGNDIQKVVEAPFEEPVDRIMGNDGGLQARLMLYKETMSPQSGIKVILANDNIEVEQFCQGMNIVNPNEISAFDRLLYRKSTSTEKEEILKRAALDAKVTAIAKRLRV